MIKKLADDYRARTGRYGRRPVPRHVPYHVAGDGMAMPAFIVLIAVVCFFMWWS